MRCRLGVWKDDPEFLDYVYAGDADDLLQKDMESLFESDRKESFADAKFVVEGKEIYVHRVRSCLARFVECPSLAQTIVVTLTSLTRAFCSNTPRPFLPAELLHSRTDSKAHGITRRKKIRCPRSKWRKESVTSPS